MPPAHRETPLCDELLPILLVQHSLLVGPSEVIEVLRHQDVRHPGYPDWSISCGGRTSWWEFKHGTPSFDDFKLQLQTCRRLARASYCRYVIWQEAASGHNPRTMIVHPDEVLRARRANSWWFTPEDSATGFDHAFIAQFILRTHYGPLDA